MNKIMILLAFVVSIIGAPAMAQTPEEVLSFAAATRTVCSADAQSEACKLHVRELERQRDALRVQAVLNQPGPEGGVTSPWQTTSDASALVMQSVPAEQPIVINYTFDRAPVPAQAPANQVVNTAPGVSAHDQMAGLMGISQAKPDALRCIVGRPDIGHRDYYIKNGFPRSSQVYMEILHENGPVEVFNSGSELISSLDDRGNGDPVYVVPPGVSCYLRLPQGASTRIQVRFLRSADTRRFNSVNPYNWVRSELETCAYSDNGIPLHINGAVIGPGRHTPNYRSCMPRAPTRR